MPKMLAVRKGFVVPKMLAVRKGFVVPKMLAVRKGFVEKIPDWKVQRLLRRKVWLDARKSLLESSGGNSMARRSPIGVVHDIRTGFANRSKELSDVQRGARDAKSGLRYGSRTARLTARKDLLDAKMPAVRKGFVEKIHDWNVQRLLRRKVWLDARKSLLESSGGNSMARKSLVQVVHDVRKGFATRSKELSDAQKDARQARIGLRFEPRKGRLDAQKGLFDARKALLEAKADLAKTRIDIAAAKADARFNAGVGRKKAVFSRRSSGILIKIKRLEDSISSLRYRLSKSGNGLFSRLLQRTLNSRIVQLQKLQAQLSKNSAKSDRIPQKRGIEVPDAEVEGVSE